MSSNSSYWCYRCTQFIQISSQNPLICPQCATGFIESLPPSVARRRDRFNPVIVLRDDTEHDSQNFNLYYDVAPGSGRLRPVPEPISEFLMGSGLDRLLDQLSNIETARPENPPASKTSIESLPTVEICSHDSYCAVCKDAFEVGSEAKEMPCQHIYHSECIIPWLSIRNTCPVCRAAIPGSEPEEVNEGLAIWRLPGGGVAVGRWRGGVEREFPAVYTEMDGGLPRRVAWGSRRRNAGGFFLNFVSFFGRLRFGNGNSETSEPSIERRRSLRRRSRGMVLEDGNGMSRW